ncbi:hypothetical protein V6N13_021257 [Hibiscus sabdariffa]
MEERVPGGRWYRCSRGADVGCSSAPARHSPALKPVLHSKDWAASSSSTAPILLSCRAKPDIHGLHFSFNPNSP